MKRSRYFFIHPAQRPVTSTTPLAIVQSRRLTMLTTWATEDPRDDGSVKNDDRQTIRRRRRQLGDRRR